MSKNSHISDDASLNEMFFGIGRAKEEVAKDINRQHQQEAEDKKRKKISISEDDDLDALERKVNMEIKAIGLGFSLEEYEARLEHEAKAAELGISLVEYEIRLSKENKANGPIEEQADKNHAEEETPPLADEFAPSDEEQSQKENALSGQPDIEMNEAPVIYSESDKNYVEPNYEVMEPVPKTESSAPAIVNETAPLNEIIKPREEVELAEMAKQEEDAASYENAISNKKTMPDLTVMFDCRELGVNVYCYTYSIFQPSDKSIKEADAVILDKGNRTLAITSAYLKVVERVENLLSIDNIPINKAEVSWVIAEDIYSEIKALI